MNQTRHVRCRSIVKWKSSLPLAATPNDICCIFRNFIAFEWQHHWCQREVLTNQISFCIKAEGGIPVQNQPSTSLLCLRKLLTALRNAVDFGTRRTIQCSSRRPKFAPRCSSSGLDPSRSARWLCPSSIWCPSIASRRVSCRSYSTSHSFTSSSHLHRSPRTQSICPRSASFGMFQWPPLGPTLLCLQN